MARDSKVGGKPQEDAAGTTTQAVFGACWSLTVDVGAADAKGDCSPSAPPRSGTWTTIRSNNPVKGTA